MYTIENEQEAIAAVERAGNDVSGATARDNGSCWVVETKTDTFFVSYNGNVQNQDDCAPM